MDIRTGTKAVLGIGTILTLALPAQAEDMDWQVRRLLQPTPEEQQRDASGVSAHESTPVFRAQPAPDFLLPYHHAGERDETKRCH